MENSKEVRQKRFHITIGEKIAYVEIISLKNHIYAVEFSGHEPVFITKIKDKNNKQCWISIPQGNDDLAIVIGNYIEEQFNSENQ